MNDISLGKDYFDALYQSNADPWRFETSEYEAAKYRATLAALPRSRYGSGIEMGCSIGVLTRLLARLCDRLVGLDIAASAIDTAKQRCADLPHVEFEVAKFPHVELDRKFDLILLSEVLYYFGDEDVAAVADTVRNIATAEADIVCVHWLGPTPDYPKTGDQAVVAFEDALGPCDIICRDRQPEYRLDIFRISPSG